MTGPYGMRRRSPSTKLLVIGAVSTLVLAVMTFGGLLSEQRRVDRASLAVADQGLDSTYYLADIGKQLTRMRSRVALALALGDADAVQPLPQFEGRLLVATSAISGKLDPLTAARWAALEPDVERSRGVYAMAASAIRRGEPGRAQAILEQEDSATARLHDALDELNRVHHDGELRQLHAVHQEVSTVGWIAFGLGATLFVGLVCIWTVLIVILRRQGRELAAYTSRLELANADLDAFAGRVAHDLRNALGPSVLAPELLRQAPANPAWVAKIAGQAERSSRKALDLVDALLAFSRAQRVEQDEAAALRAAVSSVLEELAPVIARLDVTVEVDDLPEVFLRCSPGLLHVVLANVCGNAVKHLEGRSERRVHISARELGATCRIDVMDTGPGIPAAAQQAIFEPFVRVQGTVAAGTGIGLATVRRIVTARGGRVAVESEVDRGACFHVWIPLATAPVLGTAPDAAPVMAGVASDPR